MLGSQEKILEPKVNVKFFTVDPYTPCNRVSRPFLICPIWQIWSLVRQKNMFFGGLVKKGYQIWIVFRATRLQCFKRLANELKSIRGSWGNHFGSISGVIDQFGGLWAAPKPNSGHSGADFDLP